MAENENLVTIEELYKAAQDPEADWDEIMDRLGVPRQGRMKEARREQSEMSNLGFLRRLSCLRCGHDRISIRYDSGGESSVPRDYPGFDCCCVKCGLCWFEEDRESEQGRRFWCEKCGSTDLCVRHQCGIAYLEKHKASSAKEEWLNYRRFLAGNPIAAGEHLWCKCRRCGNEWLERIGVSDDQEGGDHA